eukprot:m.7305 g.7305  ORF g.7305 m.7305 type:complete len:72 (-) comp2181_c0_seq1:113-328(-)
MPKHISKRTTQKASPYETPPKENEPQPKKKAMVSIAKELCLESQIPLYDPDTLEEFTPDDFFVECSPLSIE